MKRVFLIVSVVLATVGNVMAQDTASEREGWQGELFGDVESIEVATYVGVGPNKEYFSSEVYQFNEYGNVDSMHAYLLFGMPTFSIHYTYDDQQRLTDMEFIAAEGYMEGKYTYNYDQNGNVVSYVEYEGEQTIKYRTLSQYDANNREIEEVKYDGDDVNKRTTWAYNSRGECVEIAHYEADGSVVKYCHEYSEYLFDNPVVTHVYNGDELVNTYTRIYDTDGNLLECNSYSTDGELQNRSSYKYDGGKLMEKATYSVEDGELVVRDKESYSYDHMGNVVEMVSLSDEDEGLQPFCTVNYLISYRE